MQTHSLDLELSSSQYAKIADASQTGLDLSGNMSFEFWLKLEQLPSTAGASFRVITKTDGASARAFVILFNNNIADGFECECYGDGTTNNRRVGTSAANIITAADVGVWVHWAATFNISTGAWLLYKNGMSLSVSTNNAGTVSSVYNSSAPFSVGAQDTGSGASAYVDGKLKDVRVFNDIRTQAEIVADARTEQVSDANLVAEWNFNNSYLDNTANNNDLTSSGSPTFSTDIPWEEAPDISGSTYLETNLVSFWDMDEASGATREDLHGANDLANNGTVGSEAAKIGNGAITARNSNYLSIADASQSGLDFSGSISMALWVKFTSLSNSTNNTIAAKFSTSGNQQYGFVVSVSAGGVKTLRFFVHNGSSLTDQELTVTLSTGQLYHLVATYDATNGVVRFYVDGIMVGQFTSYPTSPFTGGSAPFRVGNDGNGSSGLDGTIDEFAIYARVLHYGDVLDLYNEGSGITYSSSLSVQVDATVVTATLSTPAPSISGGASVAQGTPPTATFSTPAPAISGEANVAPNALTATFSIPAPNIITPDAQVDAGVLTATFSLPTPDVSGAANVEATVLTATFSQPAASVQIDVQIDAAVQEAIFTTPPPTVSAISNITVSPSPLTATFSIPAPTITAEINAVVEAGVLTATFSIPAATVTAIRNVEVSASVLTATFSVQAPTKVGGLWTAQPRVNGDAAWTPQPRAV